MTRRALAGLLGVALLVGCGPSLSPEEQQRLGAAQRALKESRAEEVEALLTPLLDRDPPVADAEFYAGWAAYQLTDYGRCAELMGAAVKRDPGFWPHARVLGFAHYKLGEYAAARAVFERILSAPPKDAKQAWSALERCRLHYGLGQVALTTGDLPTARENLSVAIELDASYLKARFAWSELLAEEGEPSAALLAVDELLLAWPAHPDALYLRAELLAELGREAEAEAALLRWREVFDARASIGNLQVLVAEGRDMPEAWLSSAQAFLDLGDRGEALRALQTGVNRHPDSAALADALAVLLAGR